MVYQILQALVKRLHTEVLTGLDGGVHLGNFVFANQDEPNTNISPVSLGLPGVLITYLSVILF